MIIFNKILSRIKKQHLTLWGVVLLLLASGNINAQKGFSLTGGLGTYELANVGVQWNFSQISSLSVFGGTNLGLNNNTAWATGFSFEQVFQKPQNWKLKPGYSVGAIFWTHNDELYFFKTMSIPVMALVAYPISSNLTVRAEGGVAFSKVMQSDRKQNVTAGYPERFNGNFAIKFIYKFSRNER